MVCWASLPRLEFLCFDGVVVWVLLSVLEREGRVILTGLSKMLWLFSASGSASGSASDAYGSRVYQEILFRHECYVSYMTPWL